MKGFSGIVLEVISREVQCHYCDQDVHVAFLVARYRGTQSACQNLHYHKECLLKALAETPPTLKKLSRAECLICQKGLTNWKFVLRNYNYGGYHHSCLVDFINEHSAEYELMNTIGADTKKKKEARRNMKLLKEEGE